MVEELTEGVKRLVADGVVVELLAPAVVAPAAGVVQIRYAPTTDLLDAEIQIKFMVNASINSSKVSIRNNVYEVIEDRFESRAHTSEF